VVKISIITVCYNSIKTIEDTINSVYYQDFIDIEYIIIDGGSNDGTNEIIINNIDKVDKYISENDEGLYDAINKGIEISTGDIIGILNSDDTFSSNDVVSLIVKCFEENEIDVLFGDIAFVGGDYSIKRKYSSKYWKPSLLKYGYMPAHPTFYCRKELFNRYGNYSLNYKIAADFELIARFFTKNRDIKYLYIPYIMVYMKLGGISTSGFKSKITILSEIMMACRSNEIKTSFFHLSLKYLFKGIIFIIQKIYLFFNDKF